MEKQWKDAMAQLLWRAVDTESSNAVVKAQGYVTKPKLTQSNDVEVGNRSSEFCFSLSPSFAPSSSLVQPYDN